MGRSRLPLVAILSVVGCTKQDTTSPDGAPPAGTPPPDSQKNTSRAIFGGEVGKGASIRSLTPEERESLSPRPTPVPEGAAAQPAPEPKPPTSDEVAPSDYAEQRRRQYERRYYGKGSGIQRSELQIIGGTDGGTQPRVKE